MKYKVDFKKLSGRERLEYVWEYYRWPAAITLFFAVIIISFVWNLFAAKKEVLDIILINTTGSEEYYEEDFLEFLEENGITYSSDAVSITNQMVTGDETYDYDTMQMLSVMIAAGGSEILMGSGDVFHSYVSDGAMMDLREILSEELLEKYDDAFLFCETDSGESYPCAVSLEGTSWSRKHPSYEGCYFGVLYRSEHPEIAYALANYLLSDN